MATPHGGRVHVVLVPGFAGFDALGQLEYYAGVTQAFGDWRDRRAAAGKDAVLHYFDNLPTAGVATRAERLRRYLAKRIARGEIQRDDAIALVGHSTGGLDIRRLIYRNDVPTTDETLLVDGGGQPQGDAAPSRRGPVRASTAVDVAMSEVLARIHRVVFLSVPQFGTNIADWVRAHDTLRRASVQELHMAVEATRTPRVDRALIGVLGGLGCLACAPDILLAAQDAIRETSASRDDPIIRANAQDAASQLRLWLQHAVDDFAAINDLASSPPPGSRSPAHYSASQRERERAVWDEYHIKTMSIATLGRRPFLFGSGPVTPLQLSCPSTWPHHALAPDARKLMDISYLLAYRACAGGPFAPEATAVGGLDTTLFEPARLGATDESVHDMRIEAWDNDGIVNTASMLWPDGAKTRLVAGDHGDVIGHYIRRFSIRAPHSLDRTYASYDLLRSGTGFTEADFVAVWNSVFEFCSR